MKVAILAGGLGTRIAEETEARPKALVEIGGRPILWHIMRYYLHFGFDEITVALGYKGEMIRSYFNGAVQAGDASRRSQSRERTPPAGDSNPGWRLDLIDTGPETQTGGRIKRLAPHLGNETFMLTWCDGLADIDLGALLAFHRSHGRLATLTAIHPPARFGRVKLSGDQVFEFAEKPQEPDEWINGAYFVLEPGVFDYIEGDDTEWDREALVRMACDGELMAFRHESFWHCMDTLKEKRDLQKLWDSGMAPWKVWD